MGGETIVELNQALSIIRCFVNRRTFKALRAACLIRIPGKQVIKNFGKIRQKVPPTLADFLSAISTVGQFVSEDRRENRQHIVSDTLNSRGFHSETIVACMDILLKNKDFLCMEEMCRLIDEDDKNVKARGVRKNLLTTRNNMIAPKGRDDVS